MLQACAGWTELVERRLRWSLLILFLCEVMRAEPHCCDGNINKEKCAYDATTLHEGWYIIA
jgi:hypothetical protein